MRDEESIKHIDSQRWDSQEWRLKIAVQKHIHETIKSWSEIKTQYLQWIELTPWISDTKEAITKIFWKEWITSENIIAIPWHYKEETPRMFQVLERIKWDFIVIIYFNGSELEDKEEFNIRYHDLLRIIERDNLQNKVILAKHIYTKKVPLGMIRSDMIWWIIQGTSDTLKDPVVFWFDADTYDLSDEYLRHAREKFDADENIDFLRSQLRWTNGVKDGYVWLSEVMMHLTILAKNRSHLQSMGAATSFRLRSYIGVDWYNQDLDMWEDLTLGKMMKEKNINWGRKFWGKVYVDPRRGIQAIHEWKRFQDQWVGMKDYIFVEKDAIFSNDMIHSLNQLIQDIVQGQEVSWVELAQLSGHLDGRYFVGRNKKKIQELFLKFWNINMIQSLYKTHINENWKIVFIKKSPTE